MALLGAVPADLWAGGASQPPAGQAQGEAQEAPQAPFEPFPNMVQVAPGIWAALQPAALRFNDSNSLVIALPDAAMVVDTQADPEATKRLLDWIDEELGVPVRWLVNTHWHVDHVGGNAAVVQRAPQVALLAERSLLHDVPVRAEALLREDAEALQQRIARAEEQLALGLGLSGQELDEDEREQQRRQIAAARQRQETLSTTDLLAPSLGYEGSLYLAPTAQEPTGSVQVFSVRAHTDGDSIVWVPSARVLATGDVLDALPFGGHGHPRRWLEVLDELAALEPAVIVPGHGPVYREGSKGAGASPLQQLDRVKRLFARVISLVDAAQAGQVPFEEFQQSLLEDAELQALSEELAMDEIGRQAFAQFVPETARRAWEEAAGAGVEP